MEELKKKQKNSTMGMGMSIPPSPYPKIHKLKQQKINIIKTIIYFLKKNKMEKNLYQKVRN